MSASIERLNAHYEHHATHLEPVSEAAASFCIMMRALMEGYPERTNGMAPWIEKFEVAARRRLLNELRDAAPPPAEREVPRLRLSDFTREDFAAYLQKPVPLVLDAAAADSVAVHTWTPEMFGSRYGRQECTLVRDHGSLQKRGTLADVAAAIASDEFDGWYAHNIANVFHDYPELNEQLAIKKLAERFGTSHFLTQLFFGGPATQTGYHCADHLNFFVNVYGEKEWVFAHPRYTPLFYAAVERTGIYTNSPVDFTKSPEEQADSFPLYAFVPRFVCTLKPGDVLLNPPWWWHAVRNRTRATIAAATRHFIGANYYHNPVLDAASFIMPQMQKLEAMVTADRSIQLRDEITRDTY
jgi:hypothetical protein